MESKVNKIRPEANYVCLHHDIFLFLLLVWTSSAGQSVRPVRIKIACPTIIYSLLLHTQISSFLPIHELWNGVLYCIPSNNIFYNDEGFELAR